MKTVITQVGSYVTSDAVADAVVEHWSALAEEMRSDVVEMPVVGLGGGSTHVRLALGATMPIAVSDADQVAGFDDDGAAERLSERTRSLSPRAGAPFTHAELSGVLTAWDDSPF